jgi:glucose-1-phosphate thymidylyltransferase
VAGKTALEHLLDMFKTMPDPANLEYVFIVGPFLGETQIPAFIEKKYPDIKAHYIVQNEMKGQSHALWLAREFLHGPMQMVFSDTLIETDFSFLAHETADSVAWVMPVPDPRRFGVAELDEDGFVKRFIEKPKTMENNLVIAGCYYFREGKDLVAAIEEQMKRNMTLKNEYFLADAMSIMIERGTKIRVHEISTWLDTGTIEATLGTNKTLLERGAANVMEDEIRDSVVIKAPSFVHPSAEIEEATIGPHASIGANCRISQAVISFETRGGIEAIGHPQVLRYCRNHERRHLARHRRTGLHHPRNRSCEAAFARCKTARRTTPPTRARSNCARQLPTT